MPTAARCLVADDADDIRAQVGPAARRAGFTVATDSPDGPQALAAARTDPPHPDVPVPGATGPAVCAALRADPITADTGLVAPVRELTAGATA